MQLQNLLEKVRASGCKYHAFIRAMIDFEKDSELHDAISKMTQGEIELVGVGVFGENEIVATLARKFGLWE